MKKIFLLAVFFTSLASCKKSFFDTKPKGEISSAIIWSSDYYATLAVNGIYSSLLPEHAYGGFTWYFSTWGPDGMDYGGGTVRQGRIDKGSGAVWRKYAWNYQIIGRANDAITNLTGNEKITPALRDRFIAEAKFIRSFCYFQLWNLYGGVPILDKAVAIVDSYLPRNTADEVKDFMIKDFTEAMEVLPVTYTDAASTGRATKGGAQAMLAKVYLYNKEYSKAADEFKKLTTTPYSYSLVANYGDLFDFKTERNSEVIFDVEAISEPGLGSENDFRYGGRSLFVSGWSQTVATWATVSSYINQDGSPVDISDIPKRDDYSSEYTYGLDLIPWYKDRYKNVDKRLHANVIMPGYTVKGQNYVEYMMNWPWADHANDNPYPSYMLDNSDKACFPWRKYICVGNESPIREDAPTNIVLIRYGDILLLWAEAKNEADGPSQEIYDVVNAIKDRGGIPHISNMTQDELRQEIRLERFRELPGEGQLFFDVRRWKTAAGTDPIFGLNKEELDFTMRPLFTSAFPEKYYIWPIPEDDILLNKDLTQNPGWE